MSHHQVSPSAWSLERLQSLQALNPLRQQIGLTPWMSSQLDYFLQQGLPTRKDELWKYTTLESVRHIDFNLPILNETDHSHLLSRLTQWIKPSYFSDAIRFVWVDGHFSAELSQQFNLPNSMIALNLISAWRQCQERCEQYVHDLNLKQQNSLTALNAALMTDGLYLEIPAQTDSLPPIHLLHVATKQGQKTMRHMRHLISVGEGSCVNILEEYLGEPDAGVYFQNSVTQINLAAQAKLQHYKLQREGDLAIHMAHTDVNQHRDSLFCIATVTSGAELGRDDIHIKLKEPGAHCELNHLYLPKCKQQSANYSLIEHQSPHTTSEQQARGVIRDQGHAVFNGKIKVYPNADKTVAHQANHNLLLGAQAIVNTKPELEIYADDVKCSHGATVGELDVNALFYLQSRGIPLSQASTMLMQGFVEQVLVALPVGEITNYLQQYVASQLGDSLSIG